MTSRRLSSPAPAPPTDDDDLLSEILLRLPPQPSSLPRASLVCKRWRRLVSDPGFLHRFRAHHRRPALLGFFADEFIKSYTFTPTLDPPDRIPALRFSLRIDNRFGYTLLCCCHGRALLFNKASHQLLVWDPVTGDQRFIPFPLEVDIRVGRYIRSGAVLCAAGDQGHVHGSCHSSPFKVVLVCIERSFEALFVCVYSSEAGEWGNLIPVAAPSTIDNLEGFQSALVGGSLYWPIHLRAGGIGILQFDLHRQSLVVMDKPDVNVDSECIFSIIPAEGGELGFLLVSGFTARLWKRKADYDGVAGWVLGETIELDKLLSLRSGVDAQHIEIRGFAEHGSMMFLKTENGVFMVQLESMQFKKIFDRNTRSYHYRRYFPFASFYTAG